MSTFEREQIDTVVSPRPAVAGKEGAFTPETVNSIITNLSVLQSLSQHGTVNEVFKSLGNKFLLGALQERSRSGTPIGLILESSGGIIAWIYKSGFVKKVIGVLDDAMDNGYVTPEMAADLIANPQLIAELLETLPTGSRV